MENGKWYVCKTKLKSLDFPYKSDPLLILQLFSGYEEKAL
jgi:hypothetical protein